MTSIDSQSDNLQTLSESQNDTISDEDELNQSIVDEVTANETGQEPVEKVSFLI